MTETQKIHVGDIGTIFRLTIKDPSGEPIDVSTATTKYIYFLKPDGSKVAKTAEFYTDGEDGIIQYTSIEDDIDTPGNWGVQGWVEKPEGEFFTAKGIVPVEDTYYTT